MFGGKTKPCGFHEILRDFLQSTKPSHDRWWMNLAMSVQIVKHMLYWTTKECYWEIAIILQYNMHRYRVLCDFMYPASEFEHEWTWCNVMQRVNDMHTFSWSWLTLATPIQGAFASQNMGPKNTAYYCWLKKSCHLGYYEPLEVMR